MDTKHNGFKRKRFVPFLFNGKKRKLNSTSSAMTVAKKALREVRQLRRNVEPKMFESVESTFSPTAAGVVIHLTPMDQGVELDERSGLRCNVFGVSLQGFITQVVLQTAFTVRCTIIVFKQADTSEVLLSTDVFREAKVMAQSQYSTRKRFTVLADMFWSINSESVTTPKVQWFKKFIKLKNLPLAWSGALGTSQIENSIWMIWKTDVTANLPIVNWNHRVFFSDL